jgi:sulfate permease, SulP family
VFTIFKQIRTSTAKTIGGDLVAGLTVAIMVIPQGMANAMLAGLPPIYGLYAALVPVFIYPLFGTSRQLSVGPVALVSILVLAGLSKLADPGTPEFIELALLTAFVAGMIQILLAIFKMGFLANFLSEPVISGFTAAAAIIIGVSQLKYLLGVEVARSTVMLDMVGGLVAAIGDTNMLSLVTGVLAIAIILGMRRIRKSLPAALLAVIVTGVLVSVLDWQSKGVQVVGHVKQGLPEFQLVALDLDKILAILPLAGIICIISFIESLAIAKAISARHKNSNVDANRELFALGLAKVIGSFFLAYPNTGSFTRSAINDEAGAKTGLSSIFAGLVVGITLLFLTPLFYYLPKPVLASIVIAAVVGLIDIPYVRNLFRIDRRDFYVFLTTFILTLLLGVQQGVFAGVALSVLLVLYKTSRPHYAVLGQLEGTNTYRNIDRYEGTKLNKDYLIIRYDVDIYFGNAEHFYDTIMNEVSNYPDVKYLIVHMTGIGSIDSTGLHRLNLLVDSLKEEKVILLLAGVRGQVRDLLVKSGLQEEIGARHCYLTVQDAIEGSQSEERDGLSQKYASQHNS